MLKKNWNVLKKLNILKKLNVLKTPIKFAIAACIVCFLPFVIEWALFEIPVFNKFDNATWFSFMGSYVGAIVTIIVMFITFKKSDKENKKVVELQKRQYEIDAENEKVKKIIHVLLLDDYYFLDRNTVCENMHRYILDLHSIGLETLIFKCVIYKDNPLMDELLQLQMEEVKIYNSLVEKVPHVDSQQKGNELIEVFLETGKNLYEVVNPKRTIINMKYEGYLKELYKNYYG